MDSLVAQPPALITQGAVCAALGLSRASFHRRRLLQARPPAAAARRPSPPRALDAAQRQAVLDLLREPRFADLTPAEIYATLLDEGVYHCSIRTMYRILDDHQEVRERRDQARHPVYRKPELLAEAPNTVWSRDITNLMGPAKWSYFYLHVILDIFSRRVVGRCVADAESAALFKVLFGEAIARHQVPPGQLTLHADCGGPMKAKATAQLREPFQDPQISAAVSPALWLPRECPAVLPGVLRVVQSGPPPSRPRSDDPGPGPLRPGRCHPCRPAAHSQSRLQRPSRALRPTAADTSRQTYCRLDQTNAAEGQTDKPKLNQGMSQYR